jgi:hypothetical protein
MKRFTEVVYERNEKQRMMNSQGAKALKERYRRQWVISNEYLLGV